MSETTIRVPPSKYIHVLDNIRNISWIEIGPQTYVRREHETFVTDVCDFIKLPPRSYVKIADPAVFEGKKPVLSAFGQVKNRYGDVEIRTTETNPDPFPLYPGERIVGKIEKFLVVNQNQALKLLALRDFTDTIENVQRRAGEEWVRTGPFTYVPRVEEEIVTQIGAEVIKANSALRLSAERDLVDVYKVKRRTGEQWLIRETGSYLPRIYEKVEGIVNGRVLTDKKALKLRATKDFVDVYKKERKAGEEWLVTNKMAEVHIPDVHEQEQGIVAASTLSNRQYCVVLNPVGKDGKNQWGKRELRNGEKTFFLAPGEELENGIQEIHVLGEDEALLITAREEFTDDTKVKRTAGQKWMIQGPREFTPSVEVEILEKRKSIPLDEKEGIYIRDNNTGLVTAFKGQTYLLKAHESLWEKDLPPVVENLIAQQKLGLPYIPPKIDEKGNLVYEETNIKGYKRDKTKIVTYRVPHNTAVQLFDYKTQKSRVVFGPELVMLNPDEHFTLISLSGGKPKVENVIKTLSLNLGPDFMTDVVVVETLDHAKLSLQLSYNWHFSYDKNSLGDTEKLFSVKDFVGIACKSIASRVRGAVSSITFEDFHTRSSNIIRAAVFGYGADNQPREELKFPTNNLVITSVDIQSVEPVDKKTRDSLEKSVTLAIEITTRSQEAAAKNIAERTEQEAKGEMERQKLEDLTKSEESKMKLLALQAESASIATAGQAIAEAKARSEAQKIKGETELRQAELKSKAAQIEHDTELEKITKERETEVEHKRQVYELEIQKAQKMAEIETAKFKQIVGAIGKETLVAISRAGPEMKAKLLGGLGLKGYLVTDGKNPINLFNTANGFLGNDGKK